MNRKTLIPQPLLPISGEGEPERSPSPYLGEGFRVRAKTTVLNIDEVYFEYFNSLTKDVLS
ncbi:hypothetical protein [uncultured Nostoc sp.]|uniref:hypothetical protein n=1 Tax=uncultured Nostoc sp. TaxID=340711 RepID=UPI0035C9E958